MTDKPDPALFVPANFREEDELKLLENSDDVQKLRSILEDGEIVYRIVICFHEDSDAVLAATNRRLLFVDKRFITSKIVSYKYSEIAAVVYASHLVTQDLTFVHATGSLTVSKIDKQHGGRFLELVGQLIGGDYESVRPYKRLFKHRGDTLELSDLPSQDQND